MRSGTKRLTAKPATRAAGACQEKGNGQPPPLTSFVMLMAASNSSAVHIAAPATPRSGHFVRRIAAVNRGRTARLIVETAAAQMPVSSHHTWTSTIVRGCKYGNNRGPSLTAPSASAITEVATRMPAMESRGALSEIPWCTLAIRQQKRLRKTQSGDWQAQKRIGNSKMNTQFAGPKNKKVE